MKKLFTLMALTALAITALAQPPQKMSYQCVVRNSSGALVANQAVGMKISILQGSATGTVVFSETYSPNPQSNANGLVTIEIGSGTAITGTFSGINWASGPYFLKTETDPAGGTSYTISGTSQLLSVPYALYAKSAANGFSGNYNDLTNKPALFDGTWAGLTGKPTFSTVSTTGSYNDLLNKPTLFSGSYNDLTNKPALFDGTWESLTGKPTFANVATSGSYNDLLNKPVLFDGTWTSLSGKPAGFADGTDNVDDADNSITNEIQTLNLSGTTLTLSSGGGSVILPSSGGGDNWGTQTVVTDASLAGNGTTATPLRIADNGVSAIKILNAAVTADKLATNAVTTDKINAGAVTGAKIAQAGATAGQALKWNGTTWAPAQDETGGSGFTLPFTGSSSSSGSVFEIINTSASGTGSGIKGEIASSNGTGVVGKATASSGENWGVFGLSASEFGTGVEGRSTSATGASWGVKGKSFSPDGIGVYGFGAFRGMAGESNGVEGRGVSGKATSATGINYGVYGETFSSNGYGVFGTSPYRGVVGKATEQGVYGEVTGTGGFGVYGKSTSGFGVYGTSENKGVCGISTASDGNGIYGEAPRYGAYGKSTGSTGRAVTGEATGTASIGVYGLGLETSSTGVWGEGANQGIYGTSPSATGKGVYGQVSSATAFSGYFDGGKFYVSSNTGIKTTDPTQALDVNGNARIRSIGSGAYAGVINRTADGTLTTATSDGRLKENVQTINNGLEKVLQLHGVTFTWKTNPEYGTRIGFVAQEFEKVIPELVFTNEVDGYKGINYAEVSAVLVEAIREQQKQIEDQQKEIDELKVLVSSLAGDN